MPRFPRRENEVIMLADDMIEGLKSHGKHFPTADLSALEDRRSKYQLTKDAQMAALEAYKVATEEKDKALNRLVRRMKNELKNAETDVKDDQSKLERIGWGGQSEVTVTPPPAPPRELSYASLDDGEISLTWKQPARGQGGPVRVYEIERSEVNGKESDWTLVANAFDLETRLLDEPVGVLLRYRVLARNQVGASDPSNIVEVTL